MAQTSESSGEKRDERIVTHLITVLSVSAAMVGVCLTAIALVGVIKTIGKLEAVCDDVLAVDSVLFLVAATVSYAGLRTPLYARRQHVALVVDVFFCLSLALLAAAGLLLAFIVL